MCDWKEEQELEIEALESIYPDCFEIISQNPTTFSLKVCSEEDAEVETIEINLQFTYVEKYPEEKLIYEICLGNDDDDEEEKDQGEVDPELCKKLSESVDQLVEENLGAVVVFDIVSLVQDALNDEKDKIKQKREDEKERLEQEEKEAEMKKCHGTRVTVASFLEWKDKFVEEMRLIEEEKKKMLKKSKKLTGKEIFMKKGYLVDDSEVLEGEKAVEVDESLFENFDDLELDDELLEDDES